MSNLKKLLLLLLLSLGFVIYLGLYHIAPYAILQPNRASAVTPEIPTDILLHNLQFQSKDSLLLQALHASSATEATRGVMILVHGSGSCKEHLLSLALGLAREGIACFWADGRAHGQSEGKYCTYGYYEKEDTQQLFHLARATYPNVPIGIWGNSLGGAVAIQTLELEKGLAFGVIQSTFTDLDQVVYDYQKRITFGIGLHWATRIALKKAGRIAHFSPEKVKPIQSVVNIEQPVLIAHGDADENISVECGKQLYEALSSTDKELMIVPGAGHNNMGGADFWQQIFGFINRQLSLAN